MRHLKTPWNQWRTNQGARFPAGMVHSLVLTRKKSTRKIPWYIVKLLMILVSPVCKFVMEEWLDGGWQATPSITKFLIIQRIWILVWGFEAIRISFCFRYLQLFFKLLNHQVSKLGIQTFWFDPLKVHIFQRCSLGRPQKMTKLLLKFDVY